MVPEDGEEAADGAPVDIDKLLAETREMTGGAAPDEDSAPSAPPPPPLPIDVPEVDEATPLSDLYMAAGVPKSPYSAEKLLKIMDGLAALAPNVRHAAIAAMDAAEDAWTIEDAVLDANRKSEVLRGEQQRLSEVERAAAAKAQQSTLEAEKHLAEATATIRDQIAEMEQLLQAEASQIAAHKADIAADLEATRQACRRKAVSLRTELDRLSIVSTSFGTTPNEA